MGAAEDFEALKALADRLFDDDDDEGKDSYIGKHMKRLGYKARSMWEDPDDDNSRDDDDDLFGKRRRERRVERGPSRRRASGANWQYE